MNAPFPSFSRVAVVSGVLLLAGCTSLPTGPSVMVLPGTGQSLEAFRSDDAWCRQYALAQIGGRSAEQAQRESAVNSAVVGTVIGAAAGAAIGGDGRGAAIGAGSGLLIGSASGSDAARVSGVGTQRQYDNAYVQCMYSKGHRVPVPGNVSYSRPVRAGDAGLPPPPPGSPPSPPPGN